MDPIEVGPLVPVEADPLLEVSPTSGCWDLDGNVTDSGTTHHMNDGLNSSTNLIPTHSLDLQSDRNQGVQVLQISSKNKMHRKAWPADFQK